MNYEEMYGSNEYDEEFYMENENKLNLNDLKLLNKRFHKRSQRVNSKLGKKRVMIEYYSSGPINTTITHAISGVKQLGFLVGSSNEDLFFKVTLTTNSLPLTLFYYTPEEYERHQYATLSEELKTKWKQKYLKASLLKKTRAE